MDEGDIKQLFKPIIYKEFCLDGRHIGMVDTKHYPRIERKLNIFGRTVYKASCPRGRHADLAGYLVVKAGSIGKLASKWNRKVWKLEGAASRYWTTLSDAQSEQTLPQKEGEEIPSHKVVCEGEWEN